MSGTIDTTSSAWQPDWVRDAVFYHIYPLGFLGCPFENPCVNGPVYRPTDETTPALANLRKHYGHLLDLGVNAIYFGPIFESECHGYDTIDHLRVDRRLGNTQLLGEVVEELHRLGSRVILDGVFNHVGVHHWAFRDLRERGESSPYRTWFKGIDFSRPGPFGFGFDYRGWEGYANLPEIDLTNMDARQYVLDTAVHWVREAGIDGWRLDVAYCMEPAFWADFRRAVKAARPDAFLVGEIDQGDYRRWVNPNGLDSCTHYALYRSAQQAFRVADLSELGALLRRVHDAELGIYRDIPLFTFLSNHDVTRVASAVVDPRLLAPALILLLTTPGVPALYYGDEFAMRGRKITGDRDRDLRRSMPKGPAEWPEGGREIYDMAKRLIAVRKDKPALRHGRFRLLAAGRTMLGYRMDTDADSVAVFLNCGDGTRRFEFDASESISGEPWIDLLGGAVVRREGGKVVCEAVAPFSGVILTRARKSHRALASS